LSGARCRRQEQEAGGDLSSHSLFSSAGSAINGANACAEASWRDLFRSRA
jgi:hypothetical protein